MAPTSNGNAAAVVVARLLLPDDANPVGNVHGGTTLKLMEEAGMIAVTRHMHSAASSGEDGYSPLVRFDHMAFHKPIFVGEVASCTCDIIYTSTHSILVEVVVRAEDMSNGMTRVTNTGWLWYVPMAPSSVGSNGEKKGWKILPAVQMATPKDAVATKKYEKAKAQYEKRKTSAQNSDEDLDEKEFDAFKCQYTVPSEGRSPKESEQVLCQMVLPGDCGKDKVAFGGFVMKLMDNAAGCSAWRHCRTNVVTVAISDMDFVSWIRLGDLCTIRSKVVFGSSKSLEIEIVASVSSAASGKDDIVVAKGLFTFVSIGSDGKLVSIPKLRLESEEDMRNAYLGKLRYDAAKRARSEGAN